MFTDTQLTILVPAIIAILGLFIKHFLDQKRDQTNRDNDLAEKNAIRQVSLLDKNIEQVHSYLNDYFDAANLVIDLETKIVTMNTIEGSIVELEKIQGLVSQATKKIPSVPLLNDSELVDINKAWILIFMAEHKMLLDLIRTTSKEEPPDQQAELMRITVFSTKASFFNGKMRARLNELAQKVSK